MVLFKFYLGFIQVLFKFNKIKAGYEKKKRKYETALIQLGLVFRRLRAVSPANKRQKKKAYFNVEK